MADLKPLGSERLTGQDKIKRIMEIARFKETTPNLVNESTKNEYSISLADGNVYSIVKEKQGYIIKKNISESQIDYIEPMKNRKYFSSYSQAFKRLNLLATEINRLNENDEGVSLYGEQKKFVLKTPKPSPEESDATPPAAPPSVPQPQLPPSPTAQTPEMGGEEPTDDMDATAPTPDMGDEPATDAPEGDMAPEVEDEVEINAEKMSKFGDEEQVTFKTIQKLTGKLTQKIRTLDSEEGMTSEDMKYVINMVLSALDLKNLSSEDKEDIMAKFEDIEADKDMDEPTDEMPDDEDMTSDKEVEDIQMDMDVPVEPEVEEGHGAILDSIFKESKVDKVLSKYFEVSKKEILESKKRLQEKKAIKKIQLETKMDSVIKMSETFEQELASQKFLEENHSYQLVGKTNKKNLVFENSENQVKITPEGMVI